MSYCFNILALLSNSIKRMINGFVGKFDIDDGLYDSEDFRLVFNSIAATCKATENLRTSFRKIFRRQFEMAITPDQMCGRFKFYRLMFGQLKFDRTLLSNFIYHFSKTFSFSLH
ncbi:hypothetical protein BLOT_003220 [Blomia tropicalis]|nr:hypothetical protein BLOT_003220 [Blomia tropicalis]